VNVRIKYCFTLLMRSTFKPALRTQDKILMVQHFEYEDIKTLVLVYYQMIKKKIH